MSIWLLIVLGCGPKTVSYDVGETVEVPSMAIARPAGLVHDGVFTDETHGFSMPVLEGWVADAGPESGLMRVAMLHVATDTRVEFWVFPGSDLEPRVREGCAWSFRSDARPLLGGPTRVATCVPDDPTARRIYGTVFSVDARTMQVEVHPPNTALVEGREAGEVVLRSLRW
jgi:hypothetical protein